MMITKNIQQVTYQLRNQPLLSAITILGTALAIALIMVILIIYQAKTADYAPEVNRSRSLYVKWERTVYEKGNPNSAGHSRPSMWMVKEIFEPLTTPEAVGVTYEAGAVRISSPASSLDFHEDLLFTNAGFWKVHQFDFVAGRPYAEDDFHAGVKKAVVAESVAGRLFGGAAEAVGKTVQVNFVDYTVCGVVRDVNRFCELAYARVFAPYTSNAVASEVRTGNTSGNNLIVMLARSADDFEAIRKEVEKNVARVNEQLGNQEVSLMGQPDDFRTQLSRKFANQYENLDADYWKYGLMIGVILLVPAVNLSGLTHTRMRRRIEELGIRKAFGATQGQLVWQVLNENFVLTLIGGACGLALSYLFLWLMDGWLLQTTWGEQASMNLSMVSPVVFAVALAFCLVLNLLSAFVPAWRVAHTDIVSSLNQKI